MGPQREQERPPQLRGGVSEDIPADQSLDNVKTFGASIAKLQTATTQHSVVVQGSDRQSHKANAVGAPIGSRGYIVALIRDGLWAADFMP
jgi:hypothetical protein